MKTATLLRALFVTLIITVISGISSYAIEPTLAPAQHIQKILKDNIKYPEQAVKECCTGSVEVFFTIDDDGKINIEKTFAENRHVEQMVKDQLATINMKAVKVPYNMHYSILITFKLLG